MSSGLWNRTAPLSSSWRIKVVECEKAVAVWWSARRQEGQCLLMFASGRSREQSAGVVDRRSYSAAATLAD